MTPDAHEELATKAWYYRQQASVGRTQQRKAQGRTSSRKSSALTASSMNPRASKSGNEETPSALELFDFDCNLTHDDLKDDVAAIMAQAANLGVRQMLVPGASLEESQRAIALCRQHPTSLFPTAGVHPYNALATPEPQELATLRELLDLDEVRCVGECGLDYSPGFPAPELQQRWFAEQLALACQVRKPLFLHERLAHGDFLRLVDDAKQQADGYFPPAVVHCFTGNEQELQTYLSRGEDWYIGVTGFICKKKHGDALRHMLRHVPLTRLVLETDAPYMGFPKCRRAERQQPKKQYPNVPSALPQVAQVVAEALGRSPQEIASITTANARRFLRL